MLCYSNGTDNNALETVAFSYYSKLYMLVKPQMLYIKNCKQFIQCCISDRYKTAKIKKKYKHEHYALAYTFILTSAV